MVAPYTVMVDINGRVWAVLDILGMIILAVGAFGVMEMIGIDFQISIGLMVIGIILILISSAFIQIDGHLLRKEDEAYRRFEEIKNKARSVPNDLKEGYLIDYTAEPDNAVSYGRQELMTEPGPDDKVVVHEPY
jgi:hypothetical protein